MVTMGVRQSLGLFVSPLNTTTGLGIAAISLALAIGQFTWGVGAADRRRDRRPLRPGRRSWRGLVILASARR